MYYFTKGEIMPTIQEIVESDLNIEKGASDSSHIDNDPNMTKIAQDLGLYSEEESVAANNNEKTAGVSHMDSLYNQLFPEDAFSKTASEEKVAEEVLGARAYDYFANRMDQRILKLAEDSISQDSEPTQQLENNKPEYADEAIDTDPEYTDEVDKGDDERVVGHYEDREGEMQVKAAAMRKAILLQGLTR